MVIYARTPASNAGTNSCSSIRRCSSCRSADPSASKHVAINAGTKVPAISLVLECSDFLLRQPEGHQALASAALTKVARPYRHTRANSAFAPCGPLADVTTKTSPVQLRLVYAIGPALCRDTRCAERMSR